MVRSGLNGVLGPCTPSSAIDSGVRSNANGASLSMVAPPPATLAADTAAHCLQDGGADAKSTYYWRSIIPEPSSHTTCRHPTYTFSRSTTAQPTESVHRLCQTLVQLCRTEDLEQPSH